MLSMFIVIIDVIIVFLVFEIYFRSFSFSNDRARTD